MGKPRILALLPFLVKDALSIKILRAMQKKGFDVSIAFRENASHVYESDPLSDFLAEDRLFDLTKLSQPQCLPFLQDEIGKRRIDLVLQIGAFDLYHHLPYLKERRSKLRIVDILYNEYGHTSNHFLYENCIDGVIVESDQMRRFVERNSAKKKPNVQILFSGIDLATFVPVQERPRGSGIVVGYVGRMSDEKNPLGFVDLAERLIESVPSVTFRMFGTGDQAEIVRERVNRSKARSRLTFEGFIDPVEAALAELDVLILPTKFDGRPNIIMEANACGIPVIAAPVGGVPEMICEGSNGYLLDPHDIPRIGALLSDWINTPKYLQELKKSSRSTAVARFDSRHMFDAYAGALVAFAAA